MKLRSVSSPTAGQSPHDARNSSFDHSASHNFQSERRQQCAGLEHLLFNWMGTAYCIVRVASRPGFKFQDFSSAPFNIFDDLRSSLIHRQTTTKEANTMSAVGLENDE